MNGRVDRTAATSARRGSPRCRVLLAAALLAALLVAGLEAPPPASAAPAPTPSPTATPSLTLTASPAATVAGSQTVLTAALGVPGEIVTLSGEEAGASSYTTLGQATTDASGNASFDETPLATTTYRADFAGDVDWAPAFALATVTVSSRIELSAPAAVLGWRVMAITVSVSPQHPGAVVVLQRRKGDSWRRWHTLTLAAGSSAVGRYRATRVGRFTYRATVAADAQHAAGVSAVVSVRVRSPNPYHAPLRPAHFIVVDESQYRLYYLVHGSIVRGFDCVLGRPGLPTPLGHFHIYAKDPHMGGPYGPRRMRYLGLYAIHGTDEPWLLRRFPRNYSHGCTRLSDAHILWLYPRCPVGTSVWNVP